MAENQFPGKLGWFPNLLGWFSFVGLFMTGLAGYHQGSQAGGELAGAAYLLVGGLAFSGILFLVLRRAP